MLRKVGAAALSLLIAVLLWAFVRNLDRSSATFSVPITWDHPPDVMRLPPFPPELDVRVLATKPKLRALQASDFEVRIENPQGRVGAELIVLDEDDVDSPFGVMVQEVVPSQFTVSWDRRAERRVPVRVDVVGQPAPGYEVARAGARATPSHVRVSGPASRMRDSLTIATEPVDVSGATGPIGPERLSLVAVDTELRIEGPAEVQATVPVSPRQGRVELESVPIEVLRDAWRTSPPNPDALRVSVTGPEPALLALTPDAVRLRVDARGREPRVEDYFLEVEAAIDQDACPGCSVAGLSQTKVHVNVKRAAIPSDERVPPPPSDAPGPPVEEERTGHHRPPAATPSSDLPHERRDAARRQAATLWRGDRAS